MKKFIEYIDSCLPDEKGNKILFAFKRKTLDEMNEEFKTASSRGIENEDVFSDLIISKHNDLKGDYEKFYHEETITNKRKRNVILNIAGSVIYILVLIIAFLGISFLTHAWGQTWLIVVDGILIWIAYLLSIGVNKISQMRRIFHVFARIILAIEVMVVSVAVFLFSMAYLHVEKSWLIVIAGIAAMFICDGIYIAIKKQKLAIINYLIYIPVVSTMLYIILSAIGLLAWNTGWLLIIFGLVLDFIVIFASLAENKKYEQEVYDSWKEN